MKYRSIVIGALSAAILLSVSMTLNYRNTTKIKEFNLAVDRSEEAIETLHTLLSSIGEAETGQRGYLLTGDEDYLDSYGAAIGSVQASMEKAEIELTEIPALATNITTLRNLVSSKLQELEETIELRRDRGYQPAARIFDTDQGLVISSRIRNIVSELIETERELLTSRLEKSNEAYRLAIASGLLSGLSALASIAALFYLVRRHVDEREAGNRKLEEQSELLRTTLASIGDGVITTDRSGHVTGLNEVAEEITGWSADDAKDVSIKKIFPVYYAESGQEAAHPVISSIHSDDVVQTSHDIQLKTKHGNLLFVDCSASPITSTDDKIIGCVLTFKDNTLQRNRESALRKSEARLRAAFENTAVGIAHADTDEQIIRANQRLCETLGYSESELVGLKFSEITYEEDLPLTRNALQNMLVGEYRSQRFQKRYVRKDGQIVWVNKTISLVRDAENKPDYFITVIEDITERIAAQDALKESEAHLRRVLDNTLAFVGVLSPEGVLLEINQSALEIAGLDYEESLGTPLHRQSAWSYDEAVKNRLRDAISEAARGETVRYDETIATANGFSSIDFIINPARNDDGEVTHLIATGIDISDRKRLEEELRVVAAELSLANKRKDEFLATLAHELRNPMAPIRTGLEILRLSHDDPVTMEETREMMERQTEQLIRLVDDLLDVSRITRGKLELRKEDVALREILQRAIEASSPTIQSFGHRLHTDSPDEEITLHADPHRLAQVISNLLNNAAKYSNDGGDIYLSTKRDGDFVDIAIRDTGIGLEAEMLEFVFEMFGQVKNDNDLSTSGLGIGLTLARSLTEQHGGTITVKSEGLDKGSAFTVRIPVNKRTSTMPGTDLLEEEQESNRPRCVLVVDDSPSILKTMSMVIKLQGHDVHTASDGQDAIEKAAAIKPDIVFMDIGMPRTNGYEAAKQMREQDWGKDMTLVALTGWGGEEVSQRVEDAGFDHHVVKPPEPKDLKRLIASSVPRRAS